MPEPTPVELAAKGKRWHVLRLQVPWRRGSVLTECGLDDPDAMTAEETAAKIKTLGQQRMAMMMCMTCWDTVRRYRTYTSPAGFRLNSWDDDPVGIMVREVHRAEGRAQRSPSPLKQELLALAILVEAHQEEFATLVQGIESAPNLGTVRSRKAAARRYVEGGSDA